ncbi:MAG TPA: PAS domain-containing protein, partial [Acidobacteriaceae bacterium]|nr:PAS domain-containing protein [Acidobacteriaceae bacterium]
EQFRTLAEAIPQLCWMAHSDGYTFWYNQRWYRYTGTTPEQMEGWGWQSVHDPRTLPDERERWKASISTGEPLDMVLTLRGSDGVFRPFLTRAVPLKDSDGRVVRWFGTNTDITELHKAQEELSTSEERLRLAQKAAGIGTFEWNIQTGAKIWTPELEAMHGLPPGGFEKRQSIFEDLIHPEDRAMITELIDSALKSKQPTEAEWRVVWEDGSVHWLAGRWDVFINGSGEAVRMIGVNVDVTRRKRTEEALLTVNRKLIEAREKLNVEEKLAAMGRLASGIAHEIRNPVAMISSSLATAANSDVAAADRAEMVQIASGEAKRLEHLTTDFLTYARPGAPQRSQVPVNDLLSYVADVVKSHAAKKAIQVIYVPAENFAADVDPTQVHGALLNLVLNGMDAAHSPGSVTLGAARKQAFIQIDVQNTGEPISELDLPRIFEPFYSTKPSGTGLGLAIARRVAQTHGGDLWVSCNQKDRVTFSMTLPGCS